MEWHITNYKFYSPNIISIIFICWRNCPFYWNTFFLAFCLKYEQFRLRVNNGWVVICQSWISVTFLFGVLGTLSHFWGISSQNQQWLSGHMPVLNFRDILIWVIWCIDAFAMLPKYDFKLLVLLQLWVIQPTFMYLSLVVHTNATWCNNMETLKFKKFKFNIMPMVSEIKYCKYFGNR